MDEKRIRRLFKYISNEVMPDFVSKYTPRMLQNRPFFLSLHGKTETGKTSHIMRLLTNPKFRAIYKNRVYVVSNSRTTLAKYFNQLTKYKYFPDSMNDKEILNRFILLNQENDEDTLYRLFRMLDKTKDLEKLKLVILDNVNGSIVESTSRLTKHLYTEFRQSGYSIIKASNAYTGMPPIGRKNTTVVFMSKMSNKDMKQCIGEYCPDDMKPSKFKEEIQMAIKPFDGPIMRWGMALVDLSPNFPTHEMSRVKALPPPDIIPPVDKAIMKIFDRLTTAMGNKDDEKIKTSTKPKTLKRPTQTQKKTKKGPKRIQKKYRNKRYRDKYIERSNYNRILNKATSLLKKYAS